jgi:hypothetical protein
MGADRRASEAGGATAFPEWRLIYPGSSDAVGISSLHEHRAPTSMTVPWECGEREPESWLRGDAVVSVMQFADFRNGDDAAAPRWPDRARDRRVLTEGEMRA